MALQSLSKLDEEILVCSICLDTLKEPKILGCLHRYCKDCLANVIENIPDAGTFNCPTCRQEFHIPNGRIEGIKGDFLLEAVLENRKLERDLKEKQKEQVCSSCNKHTTMVAICPDCGGFVCDVCHSSHKVMNVFSSHNHIVTMEDIESGKVTFNVQSMTSTLKAPKCHIHKDMILHINCQTCDKLICPVCAPIHHNTHQLEETSSASERIKGRVDELVKTSVMSETTLKERMDEFRKISRTKLAELSGTSIQLKELADQEEQIFRNSEKEFLKWLEKKKKMMQEETNENIKNLRQGEAFLAKEIKMMEKFCTQTLQNMEEKVEKEIKIMHNSKMTAQILMKDVDNWAVLLSASDVQNTLQVTSRGETVKQVELAVGSLTKLAIKLNGLRLSIMGNKCWKVNSTIEVFNIDEDWIKYGHPKTICDMKFFKVINRLALAGYHDNTIELSAIESKSQTVTWQCSYVWSDNPSPKYIRVAGILDKLIYATAICDGFKISRLTHKLDKVDSFPTSTFQVNAQNAVVTCVAQYKNEPKLIVGLCGSTALHVCNFKAKGLTFFEVKVDGLNPPVSLATTEKDDVLLCDGVSNAIAVNYEGNMICKFGGRNPTDRPVVISGDRNEFVYVLWKMTDEQVSGVSYKEEENGEGENEEDNEEEEENEEEKKDAASNDTHTEPITNVVRQYSPTGEFISEFIVGSNVTMMTTMITDDDEDAVAVGTPDGLIQCYSMTSFGRTWSTFIQQQSIG